MVEAATINRFLVPLDGSALAEHAIPYVAALAEAGSEIVFFQVLHGSEPIRDLLGKISRSNDRTGDQAVASAKAELDAFAERWATMLPVKPEPEVVAGDPAAEIVHAAEQTASDLVLIGSHGRGAFGRLAFGSVADAIARTSTVPVLVVRSKDTHPETAAAVITRVVVPYDGSELATQAFPVALALAKRLGVSIHLICAVNAMAVVPPAPMMEPGYPYSLADVAIDDAEEEARQSLIAAQEQLAAGGVTVTADLAIGSPFDVIVEQTKPDDLVVLTSHGRSGIERWLLGSVGEKLVREGPAPVVIVPGRAPAEIVG